MTSPSAFLERLLGCVERFRVVGAFGFALVLLSRNAVAQPSPIDLTWQAPPECPQRAAVLSRAHALLGAKPTKVDKARVEGTIQRRDEGFELTLLIGEGGTGGQRKVWARQCDELGGAAAITLVLLLTSGSDSTDTERAPPAVEGAAAGGSGTLPTESQKESKPARGNDEPRSGPGTRVRSWRWLAAAPHLALGIGPLPKASWGLGVGLGLQGTQWSVRLLGQWFVTQAVPAPVAPYGADVKRAAAGIWGCWDFRRGGWSLSPCLEASVAALRATGTGPFLRPATQTEVTGGIGLGAVGRLQVRDWLALLLGGGAQVELSRPTLRLGTVGRVRQLAPLSALVVLGPEWIF